MICIVRFVKKNLRRGKPLLNHPAQQKSRCTCDTLHKHRFWGIKSGLPSPARLSAGMSGSSKKTLLFKPL